MNHKFKDGFTLLEISIVLVIIALIVGGIIAGQSLIRSAEVNATLTEIEQYQTAVDTFTTKYQEIPGDMSDASSYWPTCDATPANCNGDGDQAIDDTLSWFHLSLAEMIAETYGIISSTPIPGEDIPESSIENAGFGLTYGFPYAKIGNYFVLNRSRSNGTLEGALNSVESAAIDEKVDDGFAATGQALFINEMSSAGSWETSGCVNGGDLLAAPSAITWDLTNDSDENCIMIYYLN